MWPVTANYFQPNLPSDGEDGVSLGWSVHPSRMTKCPVWGVDRAKVFICKKPSGLAYAMDYANV